MTIFLRLRETGSGHAVLMHFSVSFVCVGGGRS